MQHESKILHQTSKIELLLHQWEQKIWDFLPNLLSAALIFIIFWILATLARRVARKLAERMDKKGIWITWACWSGYSFFLISGIFLALEAVELTPFLTHMLAGAGILSVIIGLALKDVVSNLFSGLLLRSQHLFSLGDWVQIDGTLGQVKVAGSLTTSLENLAGQCIDIPNHLVYQSKVTNFSTNGKLRVILSCGVAYGEDLARVHQIALSEAQQIPQRNQDMPIDCYFTEIGSSSYQFILRFWINFQDYNQYLEAMSTAIMQIKARFDAEKICVAYNTTTLDFGVKGGVTLSEMPISVRISPNSSANSQSQPQTSPQ
ncbi:mechanosensitive ion channel family protein [Suttonella ornithocola]|uniref:Small-conductance mechanosensitive channel n=1 Tax=Suttonella ornithocola TaxID=279832 RepID=A0A380N019_9GAMM|nr:mechanosensitive ion channel family protein [Suttonella ornithocola]SUO97616.1 Small-conductance mechanosensitive channel [Suttonella ornithocola]